MNVKTDEVRRVLLGMKEQLVNGWAQGKLFAIDGVCLYGALIRAVPVPLETRMGEATYCVSDLPVASEVLWRLANRIDPAFGRRVDLWNDSPDRTQFEVVALIDDLLADLDEREERDAAAAEAVAV